MNNMRIILPILTFLLALLPLADAEIITLKTGKVVEAPVLEDAGDYIRVDVSNVLVTIFRDEIESIKASVEEEQDTSYLIDLLSQSVVVVRVFRQDKPDLLGTGFIISDDGLIVTNFHLIFEAKEIEIETIAGDVYAMEFIANYNEDLDLAVLKVLWDKPPVLILGDSDTLKKNDKVFSIGHPGGELYEYKEGMFVSRVMVDDQPELLVKIPSQQGSSGSPIFNSNGRVVGISVSGSIEMAGFSYGIPINLAKNYLNNNKIMSLEEFTLQLSDELKLTFLGRGALLEHKDNKAIDYFQKALQRNPDYLRARVGLAKAYTILNQQEEAAQAWKQVLTLNENNQRAHLFLGNMYLDQEKFEEAIVHLQKAVDLAPQSIHVYNNLGMAYGSIKNNKKAIEYYEKAIEMDTNFAKAYFNLSAAYYNARDFEKSKVYCIQAIELGYNVPEYFLNIHGFNSQ